MISDMPTQVQPPPPLPVEEDEFELPDRAPMARRRGTRKTKYEAAGTKEEYRDNEFTYVENDVERTGVARLKQIRFNRLAVRPQEIAGVDRLVVSSSIIFDDEVIGRLDADGKFIAHELYTSPRYAKWRDRTKRPHRIHASQWVQPQNFELLREFVDALHSEHGWRIIENPSKSETRETQDLFIAIAPGSDDDENMSGTLLDAIEISTNPAYADGFISFWDGLNQQQERWDFAQGLKNKDHQRAALIQVAQNIHFLGGVYTDTKNDVWARATDVGAFWVGGQHFPLYKAKGQDKLSEDIFAKLRTTPGAAGEEPTAPTPDELDLPDPDSF